MNAENDRLPYEKPTLLCLTLEPGIVKGGSNDVEQPTPEDETNPDPLV